MDSGFRKFLGDLEITGSLGIGTDTPGAKLEVEVSDNDNVQGLLIDQLDTTNNPIAVEINNDSTNHSLYVHQDGALASSKHALYVYSNTSGHSDYLAKIHNDNASAGSGCLRIENDASVGLALAISQTTTGSNEVVNISNAGTGMGVHIQQNEVLASSKHLLYVYSNYAQTNAELVYLWSDNASSTADLMRIENHGGGDALDIQQGALDSGKHALSVTTATEQDAAGSALVYFASTHGGSSQYTLDVRSSNTAGALWIQQDGVLSASNYGLYLYSNAAQTNGGAKLAMFYMDNASSTEPVIAVQNDGTGEGLEIVQSGNGAAMYIHGATASRTATLIQIAEWVNTSTCDVMTINNYGSGTQLYIANSSANHASGKHHLHVTSATAQTTSPLVKFALTSGSASVAALYVSNAGSGKHIDTDAGSGTPAYLSNSGTWTNASSTYSTKENISELKIEGFINKLNTLKLFKYQKKDERKFLNDKAGYYSGYILDDESTPKELLAYNNQGIADPEAGLSSQRGVEFLLAVCKEQQKIIDNLKARIETLEEVV